MASIDYNEVIGVMKPLFLFTMGMVIYAIFIFKFYLFIARRDVFQLNLKQYARAEHPILKETIGIFLYCLEYLFFFPMFLFFWFAVFTILLSALSKEPTINNILLLSVAIVAAVRVTAYYKEDLSKDLAKMLPFALLGVFVVDISFFNTYQLVEILKQIPTLWKTILYYLVFVVAIEYILRIAHGMIGLFKE